MIKIYTHPCLSFIAGFFNGVCKVRKYHNINRPKSSKNASLLRKDNIILVIYISEMPINEKFCLFILMKTVYNESPKGLFRNWILTCINCVSRSLIQDITIQKSGSMIQVVPRLIHFTGSMNWTSWYMTF